MTTATVPQHMQALAYANRIRLARAAMKRQVRSGTVLAADVLTDPDPEYLDMPLDELLSAQNRWGRSRTAQFCEKLAINERTTLRHLTAYQRRVLAAALKVYHVDRGRKYKNLRDRAKRNAAPVVDYLTEPL